ncbi:hypothetical protein G9A89_006361 [Geosiphon pyriformis]|nr:hypothetical protein G9A89_006361 [Geosiphon pyriformis]
MPSTTNTSYTWTPSLPNINLKRLIPYVSEKPPPTPSKSTTISLGIFWPIFWMLLGGSAVTAIYMWIFRPQFLISSIPYWNQSNRLFGVADQDIERGVGVKESTFPSKEKNNESILGRKDPETNSVKSLWFPWFHPQKHYYSTIHVYNKCESCGGDVIKAEIKDLVMKDKEQRREKGEDEEDDGVVFVEGSRSFNLETRTNDE